MSRYIFTFARSRSSSLESQGALRAASSARMRISSRSIWAAAFMPCRSMAAAAALNLGLSGGAIIPPDAYHMCSSSAVHSARAASGSTIGSLVTGSAALNCVLKSATSSSKSSNGGVRGGARNGIVLLGTAHVVRGGVLNAVLHCVARDSTVSR